MFAYAEGYVSKVRFAHEIPAAQILFPFFFFILLKTLVLYTANIRNIVFRIFAIYLIKSND